TALPNGGLPGISNAVTSLSLTLVAIQNIINQGTITSANNLTAIAGGSISNAAAGVMQAVNNLNLNATSIINQGVLSSLTANVSIANLNSMAIQQQLNTALAANVQNVLNINNAGGTIRALNGAVNIGNEALTKQAILSMLGGVVSAQQINFNGGAGSVRATVDQLN